MSEGIGAQVNNKEVIKITQMVKRMRIQALEMAFNAGNNGAHLGGGLSCMEILGVLYGSILKVNPNNPMDEGRDRFILSKAHAVLAYYTALYEKGFLDSHDLEDFERNGAMLTGHPTMNLKRGIEFSGGSLGHGPGLGIGAALAAKKRALDYKVFVLLGDGECQEGSVWEAGYLIPSFNLDNIIFIIDANNLQYDGYSEKILSIDKMALAFGNLGWDVASVDGHNIVELLEALTVRRNKPLLLVARTIKGKGVSFMEDDKYWHHGVLSQQLYSQAMAELEQTDE